RGRRGLVAADFDPVRVRAQRVGVMHHVGAQPQHLLLNPVENVEAAHRGSKGNMAWSLKTWPFACTLRSMSERTRDLRVESFRPLLPPAILLEEHPLNERGSETVPRARRDISRILRGEDDRLVVIVGPCSIH